MNVTSYRWKSKESNCYIGMTAHFVDENWSPMSRVLGLKYLDSPSSPLAIFNKMNQVLLDWRINDQVSELKISELPSNNKARFC